MKSSPIVTTRTMPLLVGSCDPEQFALFPSESGGGVTIAQDEMLRLSQAYSKLYQAYIARLTTRLTGQFDIAEPAASLLARRVLVPLIHCFMDRLVRVKKAIDCAPGRLSTPRQDMFPAIDTIEDFELCVEQDPTFNQSMIGFVGRVWQLPESDAVPGQQPFTLEVGFKNNMFDLYPRTPWRVLKKVWRKCRFALPSSGILTLSMANSTNALVEHGFYPSYLREVEPGFVLDVPCVDGRVREQLFSDDFVECVEFNEFLTALGLGVAERDRASLVFKEFIHQYYPVSLLEAIPNNMERARKVLGATRNKTLVMSGAASTWSSYMLAAAKQAGLSIVKCQHGGHYGYMADMSQVLEILYPYTDQFVSWGWSRLPTHPPLHALSAIALPSPWLSERKRFFSDLTLHGKREYDFLFMPNMMKRFPASAHGAGNARIDFIQEFSASLKMLVRTVTENGFSILHKPYNPTTTTLLAKTMRELETIGGEQYACEQQLNKGLTHEILGRCHVVLWDQPGTGFLECLSSNIPTLVYWPRMYNREEVWAKPFFSELEQWGIIHRDVDSLIEEFGRFKESPQSWMTNPERVVMVGRFCREFAWTSDEWPEYWRRYLDGLPDSRMG